MHYKTIERTPSVEEYNAVRLAAGLTVKDELAAQLGSATRYSESASFMMKQLWVSAE